MEKPGWILTPIVAGQVADNVRLFGCGQDEIFRVVLQEFLFCEFREGDRMDGVVQNAPCLSTSLF